jgi:hypothetical protein
LCKTTFAEIARREEAAYHGTLDVANRNNNFTTKFHHKGHGCLMASVVAEAHNIRLQAAKDGECVFATYWRSLFDSTLGSFWKSAA